VISHECWRGRFGSNPGILGRTVSLSNQSLTIVGVAPAGFRGLYTYIAPEFWTPTAMERALGAHTVYQMVGRLAPGVGRQHAVAELDSITRRLAQTYGRNGPPGYEKYGLMSADRRATLLYAALGSWGPQRSGRETVTTLAALFMSAVVLVLLIACANAANLFLLRACKRRHEIAIRLALGSSRTRLVRQLVTESLLLALLAAALGLLFAQWGTDALVSMRTGMLKFVPIDASPDLRVLTFTLCVASLTGLIFGLAPALHAVRFDLHPTLKDETRAVSVRSGRFAARNLLVVSQVAACLVLLIGAGLCVRSFTKLATIDPGFAPRNVLTSTVILDAERYSAEAALAFVDQLVERIAATPGVRAVTISDELLPLSGSHAAEDINELEGYQKPPGQTISYAYSAVGPDYFRTLGIPLMRGREFDRHDRPGAGGVAIVNESFVRRYWPTQDPIGKRIPGAEVAEVIGVVRDVRVQQLWIEPAPHVYRPTLQGDVRYFSLLARTDGDPALLLPQLRRELRALDPSIEPVRTDTLQNIWSSSLGGQRLLMFILAVFAGTAVVLATIGLYGVMAYSVAQRVRELGIRVALGARRRDVLGLVMTRGMALVLSGLAIGLVIASATTRVLRSLLYVVSPTDAVTFLCVSALMAGVGLLACYLPARRAARIDPMEALRCE
jgi:putative ABC transport system permease protein